MEVSPYLLREILSKLELRDIVNLLNSFKPETLISLGVVDGEGFKRIYHSVRNFIQLHKPYAIQFAHPERQYCNVYPQSIPFNPETLDHTPRLNVTYARCYTDEQVIYIAKTFPNLTIFDGSEYGSTITDASLQILFEKCPNLMYISLRNAQHFTDDGLEHLAKLKKLISVDLYDSQAPKSDVIGRIIDNNPNLVEIDFDNMFYNEERYKLYRQTVAYGHCSIKFNFESQIDSLLLKTLMEYYLPLGLEALTK